MARRYNSNNLVEDEEGNIRPNVPKVIDARAPQADLTRNAPMSPAAPYTLSAPGLTPKGMWDEMFRNRFAGNNPLSTSPVTPAAVQPASSFGAGLQQSPKPTLPSLSTLAAGGTNHATAWMNGEQRAAQGQRDVSPYIAPGTTAITRFDNAPNRAPFIAGANGVNVAPQIAAKVSQNDQTLDPEFKRKLSWSSAFSPA